MSESDWGLSEKAKEIGGTVNDYLAGVVEDVLHVAMAESERSEWSDNHKIGVSDIGHCREYMRRMMLQLPFTDDQEDYTAAFMGTAIGDKAESAYLAAVPTAISQPELPVTLDIPTPTGSIRITIIGHPDIVDPNSNRVLDFKTKDGLAVVRREGGTLQQKFQGHLYTKAAIDAGLVDEDCEVSMVYIDRSGAEKKPHVITWEYDPDVVKHAEEWIGDVLYAVQHDEEASRDMPRSWCERCCPFYTGCRLEGYEAGEGEGLIEDWPALAAVEAYVEARDREKQAKTDKAAATAALAKVNGSTGQWKVRHTDTAPSSFTVNRQAGVRLSVTPVKSTRAKS